MRRGEEEEPLIENDGNEERYNWNLFKKTPRPTVSGSLEQSVYIDLSIKCLKVATIVVTFLVVLASAVVSKGSLLFMTSQIQPNITRLYCNKYLDKRQQYIVNHPVEERTAWIWLLVFSYMVPELGTLFRSLRIISFKSWKYPSIFEFLTLALTEILPAIGTGLLVFVVFPELDVIKAAMLTNGVCLVPGIVALFSRKGLKCENTFRVALDMASIIIQISPMVVWPLVENRPILWIIPFSLLLISVGWWENFTSEESIIPFLKKVAKKKSEFQNDFYFMYAILAPLKCLAFFITVLSVIWMREGAIGFLFSNFMDAFEDHHFNVTQIKPIVGSSGINYTDAVSSIIPIPIETTFWTPLVVFMINVVATYLCYAFSKFACKIMIQHLSFALPTNLVVPVLLTALISICGKYNEDVCSYSDSVPLYLFFNAPNMEDLQNFVGRQYAWVWLIWLMSQIWITIHIWSNDHNRLMPTEKIFFKPMYDAFLIDQSVAMNRRRMQENLVTNADLHNHEEIETDKDKITKIYACGTMWHETKEEMVEFLKSILRMDEDQCAHRIVREYLQYNLPNYYELETHIFFDDAFIRKSQDDPDPHVNSYVLDLIDSVSEAASNVHAVNVKIKQPVVYSTPYGGRLVWILPGRTKMIAHLKDKAKIRAKKRWSQCMYMYYLLGFRIMNNDDYSPENVKNMARNTYILALDGDIDFQPAAVHLLVDYMKKNHGLGAACGRIHPVGSGAMAWYQIFEYAVGHWLQKATEHVIGCVLCSPGCFSLFRAGALMDDNVMAKYTTEATEARHYVQYDQGEDRWLCTLMLQRGYRVEYSAASDAYTHCPEGFNEFYNQRRRWMPSTTANIMDLLTDYKHIVKVNDNISKLYILYQIVLMIGTAIGPGTIFIMLVGAFVSAFKVSQYYSMLLNLIPVLLFIIICATCKSDTQLFFAGLISAVYGLIMMTVLVGIMIQIEEDGWLAPSSLFLMGTVGEFVIAAIIHPQEFYCLKYGIIYWVTVPSMYMLLVIYSIFNMNNVSWGTREVTVEVVETKEDNKTEKNKSVEKAPPPKSTQQSKILSFFGNDKDNTGSLEFSFGGLFKMMCCTYDGKGAEREILRNIQTSLQQLRERLDNMERNDFSEVKPRRTTTRGTEVFVGLKAERASYRPSVKPSYRTSVPGVNMPPSESLEDDYDEDEDEDYSFAPSDDLEANSWYYDGELLNSEVQFIEKEEKKFWEKFIQMYLYPLDETLKKDKIEKELKDLRDRSVLTFFMMNSLFILVIFLLNLQQDIIHVNWPVGPKINFTYYTDQNEILIQKTYLQLQPIGFLFLFAFASLMFVQFIAMFIHRFGTYCQIMSNTDIDFSLFESVNVNSVTEDSLLDKDPIKIFKKLIRLQGMNDEVEEQVETGVGRRNTVFYSAMKREEKKKPVIDDLDQAFHKRMSLIKSGKLKKEPVPRETIMQIGQRRNTIFTRKSQIAPFKGHETFDNDSFDGLVLDDQIGTEVNA